MTKKDELKVILEKHKLWLNGNKEGGVRANLSGADLRFAYLKNANWSGANLKNANWSGANLEDAYLGGADD